TWIYTLSLHVALPISFARVAERECLRCARVSPAASVRRSQVSPFLDGWDRGGQFKSRFHVRIPESTRSSRARISHHRDRHGAARSEEHTSELQSRENL